MTLREQRLQAKSLGKNLTWNAKQPEEDYIYNELEEHTLWQYVSRILTKQVVIFIETRPDDVSQSEILTSVLMDFVYL